MIASDEVKAYARAIGFHLVGITSAEPFSAAEADMLRWLAEGHNAEMAWLNEARTRLACRPEELLKGAKSIVVVGVSYRSEQPGPRGVARYARGADYHDALKSRLRLLKELLNDPAARIFVDSGPLAERDAAVRAGLGFRGKNTNLLTSIGSYVFLGALLTTVELEPDQPILKDCGACTLCIQACPTHALDEPYHLQAERCIAYLTIEHRGPIPSGLSEPIGDWIFGCDVCQDVCPYNATKRVPPTWPEFQPRPLPSLEELVLLDQDSYRAAFKGSPMKRAKRRGLARNAAIALGNSGQADAQPALRRAAREHDEPLVREAAEWALTRVPGT